MRTFTKAPLVTHSVLGAGFGSLVLALREDERLRAKAMALGVDLDDGVGLAQGLVADAMQANPDGIVLFCDLQDRAQSCRIGREAPAPEKVSAAIELVEYSKFLGL